PPEAARRQSAPIVYGEDDRQEYFEAAPVAQALLGSSMVALVAKDNIVSGAQGPIPSTPSLGTAANLCPGERFGQEPSVAFCSGVLVDWDLVLTAGHCARLFALNDYVVVFGFYYAAPGALAATNADVAQPTEILAEALDPQGADPRLDFAWIRLDHPAMAPRRPAPIYVRPPPVDTGEPLLSIASGAGIPMKVDADGHVRDSRASSGDYFVADTDTSGGASGGGAFDPQGALLGVLARGGTDYVETDAGCNTVNVVPDGGEAQEQYTYAHRAVEALCGDGGAPSSICRADCGNPCQASPQPPATAGSGGCAVGPWRGARGWDKTWILLAVTLGLRRRVARPHRRRL
ncbi:MAG TPA: trypsin-like peptidase domain-containing protein, partial [Opitutaceae bacterium]